MERLRWNKRMTRQAREELEGEWRVAVETPQNFKGPFHKPGGIHFKTLGDFSQLQRQGRIVWLSYNENMAGFKFDQLGEESRRFIDGFLGIFP